jgi:hypothetical protein
MFHRRKKPHGPRGQSQSDSSELVDVLLDPHCKYLIEYLREHEDPAELSSAVRYVVARITATEQEDVSESVQRRVQTWFHHGLLPVLDEYGVVDFDPETGTIGLEEELAR